MGDMLQFLVKTPVQPQGKFYSGGTLTDLDGPAGGTCTVSVTKPDGTTGPAPGTITHVSTGVYTFTLDGPTDPTIYDIAWSGQIGGHNVTIDTQAEALGEFLYTLAALRDVKVGNGKPFIVADFPDQVLLDRRVEVTDDFEAKTGWSFIPRFTRERHSGDGTATLIVEEFKPGRLLSVIVDGTAQTLASFDLTPDGVLTWQGGTFPTTRPGNVTVEYVRGWDRPPGRISSDALAVAASWLLPAQAGSNASTWITPDGTSYSFDTAGRQLSGGGTAFYGIPKVDADLNNPAYSARGGVFA